MILTKKYTIGIFLILIIIMSMLVCGCTNTVKRTTVIKDTDIALLSIFTFDGKKESTLGLMNLGHSFLSVENTSDSAIEIGNVTIDAGKTIAIGTWSIQAHFGVWYNVESNYIADHNKYDGRLSVTTGIGLDDIEKITKFILSHDYWNPLQNCSYFALNLWNEVVEDSEKLDTMLIYSPGAIANQLRNFDTFEENRPIITDSKFHYFAGETPVYYELEDNHVAI